MLILIIDKDAKFAETESGNRKTFSIEDAYIELDETKWHITERSGKLLIRKITNRINGSISITPDASNQILLE